MKNLNLTVLGACNRAECYSHDSGVIYCDYSRSVVANDNVFQVFRKPVGFTELFRRVFLRVNSIHLIFTK